MDTLSRRLRAVLGRGYTEDTRHFIRLTRSLLDMSTVDPLCAEAGREPNQAKRARWKRIQRWLNREQREPSSAWMAAWLSTSRGKDAWRDRVRPQLQAQERGSDWAPYGV